MTSVAKPIDTRRFAEQLRARAIDVAHGRVLISRLAGSGQEIDLTLPANCNGYGRVRHFRLATAEGWPANPLPIAPACRALGIAPVPEVMTALVFQNAACAWRCWYCFVPEELLKADLSHSEWFTATELVDLYRQIPDVPRIIDLSGGSPDLVPEWTPWMMRALIDAGLAETTYLWTDDNLSTTYLFDELAPADLALIHSYRNYGRVCCIKGFDARSFSFNTRAASRDYERQFKILRRVLALGLDVYGYVTLTSPHDDGIAQGVADLMDRLQAIDPNFPLRVVPLRIQIFTPVEQRLLRDEARERSLVVQEEAIAAWTSELERRFSSDLRALHICDVPLRTRVA
ncbi:radical SAM protein [Mesorhizobium abyssinicae]|uniref:radical SAM protein n=1 Tax=Mesorhizobium abyssinicae TaxID=1209958 RepID=UPI003398DC1E